MAEDDGKGSGRSRFKSKWGKIIKNTEQLKNATDSFSKGKGKEANSQEDVDDFLKPSVERAAANRPRLDVSIAQRWPDPNEVRQAGAFPPDGSQNVNGWRKRRRREGLTVGFVKTVPETIGHGGDETMDPPSDIGIHKARALGAAADKRAMDHGGAYPRPPEHTGEPTLPDLAKLETPANIPTQPHREPAPPVQVEEQPPPPRIGIIRAPTTYSGSQDWSPISDYDESPPMPNINQLSLDTRPTEHAQVTESPPRLRVSPLPRDPNTLAHKKEHDMRSSEAMALRRASAMIEPFEFEAGDDLDLNLGSYAAATAAYRAEVAATPPTSAVERAPVVPPVDTPSPQSAASPDSPSPFADTRYIKRHSREAPPAPEHVQATTILPAAPPPGKRSPFADPKYLQSRSKDASPSRPPRREDSQQGRYLPGGTQPIHITEPPSLDSRQATVPASQVATHERSRSIRQQNADMSFVVPQGPRDPSPDKSQRSAPRQAPIHEQPSYMRAAHSTGYENVVPARPLPAPRLATEPQARPDSRDRSPPRNRGPDPQATAQMPAPGRLNGTSATSVNRFAPAPSSHSRTNSHDQQSPQSIRSVSGSASSPPMQHGNFSRTTSPPSQHGFVAYGQNQPSLAARSNNVQSNTSSSSQLGPPKPSPYARGPSPNGYFDVDRQHPTQPGRSPMASLQASDASRPGSSHSARSFQPPSHNPSMNDLAAESAFDDFAGRAAHMKGVFRLTAEKEQPSDSCTPFMWLRAAFWWYLRGKSGLETLLQQRGKSRDVEHRELLAQPHVDLAKTSWMLADPLERYVGVGSPDSRQPSDYEALLKRDILILKGHLKSLALLMLRSNMMPPPQSLIQGQDTQIWLEYPRFTPDAAAVLRGASGQRSLIMDPQSSVVAPSDALPLGDSAQYHYFHKCTVNISLNTDDVNTDRVSVPCNLTILRDRREYQSTVIIASQSELVYLRIAPRQSSSTSLTWHDVSWKSGSLAISINLPGGIDVTVRFFEHDFRTLWNLVDHSRKVDYNVRPEKGEVLAHEAQLVEVQYVDSSNQRAFPTDKVSRCRAILWERFEEFQHGGAVRKRHHGFRLVVATEPGHKSLSSFVHILGADGPLNFEFITDAAAHGTTAMVVRIREEHRQCRILLVFRDMDSRQALYNKLNGIDVKEHETIVGKMALTGLNIQSVSEAIGVLSSGHNELASLDWQRLGVTNHHVEDAGGRMPDTVESESLRIVARHSHGCVTDRLNLDKGELLLRLPCTDTQTVQILRQPQTDMTMSIDARNAPHNVLDGIADVFKVAQNMTTVRTFKFATPNDLHAFEAAITGFTVRYDGIASTLAISRRMMVVPIYHKWAASNVRIQIVANAQNTVIQLLAFMEDFAHAEALCFQVKTTDVFETIKGDGKNKKWAIKMVDAKFTLPAPQGKDEQFSPEEKATRRFVNLEGLDYAQEHDDITVGFESQEGMCYILSLNRRGCLSCILRVSANIIHSPRRFRKSAASRSDRQSIHVHETHLSIVVVIMLVLIFLHSAKHSGSGTAFGVPRRARYRHLNPPFLVFDIGGVARLRDAARLHVISMVD